MPVARHGAAVYPPPSAIPPTVLQEPEDGDGEPDQEQRRDRGLRVGADLCRAPDLGRERVEPDRPKQDRRGKLLHRGEEDERGAGQEARPRERHGDEPGRRERAAPEPARGFLYPRAHACERRLDRRERLGEETDGVREDEQRRASGRRATRSARRRRRARARSRARGARFRHTRAARAFARIASDSG